jgi:hypothetical protein
MFTPKTQDDLVAQAEGVVSQTTTRKMLIPGIEELHKRPVAEIAEILANVLRLERNVVRLTWEVGKYFEFTTGPDQK